MKDDFGTPSGDVLVWSRNFSLFLRFALLLPILSIPSPKKGAAESGRQLAKENAVSGPMATVGKDQASVLVQYITLQWIQLDGLNQEV